MPDDSRPDEGPNPEDEFRDMLRDILSGKSSIDPSQLALGPQCGFSSGAVAEDPERMTIDAEKKKLELMTRVAEKVWG